ncbi:MAG: hypothetical protein Q9181_002909 [Wetmoreana brouardii]
MTTAPDQQQQLQTLSDEYQKLQTGTLSFPSSQIPSYYPLPTDLQTQIASRQRLESQQQENLSVAREFSTLSSESKIYKLIGPVLLKQEKAEAEQAVQGRLEFIGKEMSKKGQRHEWADLMKRSKRLTLRHRHSKRVEKLITDMQSHGESKKMEVYQLQMKMQEGSK